MFDIFDVMAFVVFAVLIAAAFVVVVMVGSLPGRIAVARGHPQAGAVNVAGWVGIGTLGLLYPVAFIWAFLKPSPGTPGPARSDPDPSGDQMKARVELLERVVRDLQAERGRAP